MNTPNVGLNFLSKKYGTGIAGRADERGNHYLTQTVIDGYATNGEMVPQHLQGLMKELNGLVQEEWLLDQGGQNSRVGLAGSGYDPVGRMKRVSELETQLLSDSAYARTAKERADLEFAQMRNEQQGMMNSMYRDTYDSQRDATIATNMMTAAQARAQASSTEQTNLVDTIQGFVNDNGADMDDMLDAYTSNDPTKMKVVFGSTDRVAISRVIDRFGLADDSVAQRRLDMTTRLHNGQVRAVLNDPNITDEMLLQVANGEVAMPEGLNMAIVQDVIAGRTSFIENQMKYNNALAQGITDEKELTTLLLNSTEQGALATSILSALGFPAQDIPGMLASGQFEETINDLMMDPNIANSTLKIGVPDGQGGTKQVVLSEALANLGGRVENAYRASADRTLATQAGKAYLAEATDLNRRMQMTKALVPFALSPDSEQEISSLMGLSQRLFKQAAEIGLSDPAKRDQMLQAGREASQQAKDKLIELAQKEGAADYVLEDIRQGRFSSATSYKQAIGDFFLNGEAGADQTGYAAEVDFQMRKAFADAGIDEREVHEWLNSDSTDMSEIGITPTVVSNIFERVATQIVIDNALNVVGEATQGRRIPENLRKDLDGLLSGQIAREQNLTGDQVMNRVLKISRAIDEILLLEDQLAREQAAAAGQPIGPEMPKYQRGAIQRRIEQQMNSTQPLEAFLRDSGVGNGRGMLAFMAQYATQGTEKAASGPSAASFDQLPAAASNKFTQRLRGQVTSQTYTDMTWLRNRISGALDYHAQGASDNDLRAMEMAGLNIWASKIANPEYSTVFGLQLPSWGENLGAGVPGTEGSAWGNGVFSSEELIAELVRMGRPDLAAKVGTGYRPGVTDPSNPMPRG